MSYKIKPLMGARIEANVSIFELLTREKATLVYDTKLEDIQHRDWGYEMAANIDHNYIKSFIADHENKTVYAIDKKKRRLIKVTMENTKGLTFYPESDKFALSDRVQFDGTIDEILGEFQEHGYTITQGIHGPDIY